MTLEFYLRSKDEKEFKAGKFTRVCIKLDDQDLRKTILSILKACNLSTTFVDKIKTQSLSGIQKIESHNNFWSTDFSAWEDDPSAFTFRRRKKATIPDTMK